MKRTIYANVRYGVSDIPAEANGGQPGKMLDFYDPDTRESVSIPITAEAAHDLAAQLDGREIEVATQMPDPTQVPPPTPQPPAPTPPAGPPAR
jgi:hypothetical protein